MSARDWVCVRTCDRSRSSQHLVSAPFISNSRDSWLRRCRWSVVLRSRGCHFRSRRRNWACVRSQLAPWWDAAWRSGSATRRRSHDLGAERLDPSAQLRVGGVDQRRRPIRAFVHKFHDSIISSIPAAMPSVNHDEALGRRQHAGRLLPIEHNRPYASVAEGQRNDLGDEPSSGPGSVTPPAVRPRAHDVVAVHEDL